MLGMLLEEDGENVLCMGRDCVHIGWRAFTDEISRAYKEEESGASNGKEQYTTVKAWKLEAGNAGRRGWKKCV